MDKKEFIRDRLAAIEVLAGYANAIQQVGGSEDVWGRFYSLAADFFEELEPFREDLYEMHPHLRTSEKFNRTMNKLSALKRQGN